MLINLKSEDIVVVFCLFFFPITPLKTMNIIIVSITGAGKMGLGGDEQDDGRPANDVLLKSVNM